jgi:oxygen-independent coproporphyrinogen-3 oxidase
LPEYAVREAAHRPLGFYLHLPFCASRGGYCDFNTYTADELGEGATRASYADTAIAEIRQASNRFGPRPVETVFFGGGTPTQLPASDLVRIRHAIDEEFGLAPNAEVTTEANPDSVTPESLAELRAGGFTRVSFGMQSAVPHVLAILDRTHDPERVPMAVAWARQAGFEHVSVDLIYGTPGESLDDWRASLEAAVAMDIDHVSAYALIVEDGTAFARKVARGEVVMPDDDETAAKYELADAMLGAAGFEWYELSNWARSSEARCRHNELYWTGADWLGIGPGAHAHVAGRRWWNVKHPAAYAQRLAAGESPEADGEDIDASTARLEDVMLRLRLREGIETDRLKNVAQLVADGLLVTANGHATLTLKGRLLADHVIRSAT